jgi:hypothetical protein
MARGQPFERTSSTAPAANAALSNLRFGSSALLQRSTVALLDGAGPMRLTFFTGLRWVGGGLKS